jgi:4-oxalocrotonate tautomerase
MPIVTFHLADGLYTTQAMQQLLLESSRLYSRVLDSPMERVRALVELYPPELVTVAGEPVSESPRRAPYFEFLVLSGRPPQQRHELLRGFTGLLVQILDAPRDLVRGRAVELDPDNWAIGGEPASLRRAAEISARADAASTS